MGFLMFGVSVVVALVAGQVSANLSGNALIGWLCAALVFMGVYGTMNRGTVARQKATAAEMAALELADRRVWVKEYRTAQEFDADAQQMVSDGWQVGQQSQGSTHMNVGRTLFSTIVTGGFNLLTPKIGGASYTKGKLAVTWVRPPV